MRRLVEVLVSLFIASVAAVCATADIFEDHKDEIERLRAGKSISMTGLECSSSVTTQITGGAEAEKLAAESGSAIGAFQLGRRYLNGIGVPRDFDLAVKYLKQSAAKDNAEALFLLGRHEVGVEFKSKRFERAVRLLNRSQTNGCAEASVWLGEIHRISGELVAAERVFLEGTKSGLPLSFSRLIILWLSHPAETSVDWARLEKMIRPIAEQKDPSAMQNLATVYSAQS